MSELDTSVRTLNYDVAYRLIVDAHRGLSDEDSARLNARLVLLLANHIGDLSVLEQALALAQSSADRGG